MKRRERIALQAKKLAKIVSIDGSKLDRVYRIGMYHVWYTGKKPFSVDPNSYVVNKSLNSVFKYSHKYFSRCDKYYKSCKTLQEALELDIRRHDVAARLLTYLKRKGIYD